MSGSLLEQHQFTPLVYPPVTKTSVAETDIFHMENYQKVTFILGVGTVTSGGNVTVRQMDDVGDSVAAASTVDLDLVYECPGNDTWTRRTADNVSSIGGVTIGSSDSSHIYMFEVRASQLSSANDCVALYFESSGLSVTLVSVLAIGHESRFPKEPMLTALA